MAVMVVRWKDEKISGRKCPGYLYQSYVIAITRPPRQHCGDIQPRSILRLRVSSTNSHLSLPAYPKSSANVEDLPRPSNDSRLMRHAQKVYAIEHSINAPSSKFLPSTLVPCNKDRAINQAEIADTRHGLMK
ncbi:hypothetical protein FQN60_000228 [Etheostoma spectabile]|uniref:Uncharacterized protein n=1 Tax=Etheostoma spectabile TaxID=54343 RepID=A0A5J5CVN2_9PERO|nr:hypothetical protein FQN60_000228 [Etheostoma spectabile]